MRTNSQTDPGSRAGLAWAESKLPDAEIVTLVLSGNQAAFEAIMRRYNRLLFRLARSIVPTNEDAEDVLQECYVRAYFRLSQFRGPGGFASWISRIVINEAYSRMRRRETDFDDSVAVDDLPMDTQQRPDRLAAGRDTLEMIESAVDGLPANFRVVFMLRGVEGLSVDETSRILGVKPATIKTRFHRARTMIRNTLARRMADAVPTTFSFDGARCDRIVHDVLARMSGVDAQHHQ